MDFPILLHQDSTTSKVNPMGYDLHVFAAVTDVLSRDRQLLRDRHLQNLILKRPKLKKQKLNIWKKE